ncbi:hypothetical protein [Saccharomonospora viridis]|uniref:hypothetical protein n=1 Tax=Saccharomonospora viridis TaxID=1852 RepID=UPI00117C1D2D|nr:hypothetical protein [Saccharomonospora viridis]
MDDISLRAGQLHQWLDFAHVDREQQLTFRNPAKLMSKVRQPMSTLVTGDTAVHGSEPPIPIKAPAGAGITASGPSHMDGSAVQKSAVGPQDSETGQHCQRDQTVKAQVRDWQPTDARPKTCP